MDPNILNARLQGAWRLLRIGALLTSMLVLGPRPAGATSEQPYFSPGGPSDRPLFTGATLNGDRLTFHFNGVVAWELYHVRHNGKQFDNHSGEFTITGVKRNHIYKIHVQGVNKHTFGHDDCSPWTDCIWVVH